MKTSKRILDHLSTQGPSTVAQLSGALERTKADIREQMGFLLTKNLVVALPAESADVPGRPAARFMAVQKTPDLLVNGLVAGLIGFMTKEKASQDNLDSVNKLIVNSLLTDFHPSGTSSASRLNQAVAHIEKLGIYTKWVATKTGPRITIVRESFTPLFQNESVSKKITKQLIQSAKEKAVGFSPTA